MFQRKKPPSEEKPKKSKYGNVRTEKGDSQIEVLVLLFLEQQQRLGSISNLQKQTTIILQEDMEIPSQYLLKRKKLKVKIGNQIWDHYYKTGCKLEAITYKPDFEFDFEHKHIVLDVKGFKTADYKIKAKMVQKKAELGEYYFFEARNIKDVKKIFELLK